MTRGIPWDDLTKWFSEDKNGPQTPVAPVEVNPTPREFDLKKDATEIGKRVAFGTVCGGLTGASFGAIDALRDTKNLTGNSKLVSQKVMRYTGVFAGFFGMYHGTRKILKLCYPQSSEVNVATSAVICIAPLIIVPSLRAIVPYGIVLVGLDAINGMDDI